MADGEGGDRGGIQVIARAAAVLRSLKNRPEGLSLGQIAADVGLPRSTVQRIVAALTAERLVMAAGPEGGFRLGPELRRLGESARIDLADFLRPHIRALSERVGETVDLAVLRGGRLIFIDQIAGAHRLRAVSAVGESFPLTVTANGKACLALMPEAEAGALAAAELRPQRLAHALPQLLAELRSIRSEGGIAFDLDEHTPGISAAGAAFRDPDGGYCAISIPTPSQRFEANRAALVSALRGAAAGIEAALAPLRG